MRVIGVLMLPFLLVGQLAAQREWRWDMAPRAHFSIAEWQADDLVTVRRGSDDPLFPSPSAIPRATTAPSPSD